MKKLAFLWQVCGQANPESLVKGGGRQQTGLIRGPTQAEQIWLGWSGDGDDDDDGSGDEDGGGDEDDSGDGESDGNDIGDGNVIPCYWFICQLAVSNY